MTGFGRAVSESDTRRFQVEARSVNHRSLDLSIRLPQPARSLEPQIRELIAGSCRRGRVEISVEVESRSAAGTRDLVDSAVLRALATQLTRAGEVLEPPLPPPTWSDLLTLPGIVRPPTDDAWLEADEQALLDACARAVASVEEFREREGRVLESVLDGLLSDFETEVDGLVSELPELLEQLIERARNRVVELVRDQGSEAQLSPDRWAQEMAILAERSDVTEEVDRLRGHIDQFRELIVGGGAVGRELDFLCQEILRECQTLGAKSRSLACARYGLELKVLADRMREQVQNVE